MDIKRDFYLNKLIERKNDGFVKFVTGIRRCGKSYLLNVLFKEHLRTEGIGDAQIIELPLDDDTNEALRNPRRLSAFIRDRIVSPDIPYYALIDEIQMCDGFEKAINSLHAKEKYDIYVTGSNAFLQSSDLATLFVGRTYEVHILPFSFNEYLSYYPSDNIYGSLTDYLTEGGMAGSYLYATKEQKYRYINTEVLNALIVRDIVQKYKIRNEPLLHTLIDFLMDNIGNIVSIRSITNTLMSNKTKADHKTIGKYIEYLCKAFAFYKVRRYDIKGKRYLRSDDKYYLSDHGFKYARHGTKNMDYGHVLENIVAIELIRRGYELYIGVLKEKEVDFVAIKQGTKEYIQVSYDITDPNTFEREVSPLLNIKDAYPKTLIARTYQPEYQHEGIRIIDAADWLTKN